MFIPDMSERTYAPEMHEGIEVRSVGWLGEHIPRLGDTPPSIIETLRHFRRINQHDDNDFGDHECEICGKESSHGEFWIEAGGIRYVLPVMVFHYIDAHGYAMPPEFVSIVEEMESKDESSKAANQCVQTDADRPRR